MVSQQKRSKIEGQINDLKIEGDKYDEEKLKERLMRLTTKEQPPALSQEVEREKGTITVASKYGETAEEIQEKLKNPKQLKRKFDKLNNKIKRLQKKLE